MGLDSRKLAILQAIIDDYILTATPVGSRTISKRIGMGLSSATIRNEMSDLHELGLLEQPHTSAGRIPSDKAYRLYVNNIMSRSALSDEEAQFIKKHYDEKLSDIEDVIKQTANVLSSMTHYISMALTPSFNTIKLRRIQLIKISETRALAIIITDIGVMKDAVIRLPTGIDDSQLEKLSNMLTKKYMNRKLTEAGSVLLKELQNTLSDHREFLDSVATVLLNVSKSRKTNFELSGTTNILLFPEYSDVLKARQLIDAIEGRDLLYDILDNAKKVEFSITIGSENESLDMQDCSVVTATYRIGGETMGSFGVIGPKRMDYSKILAILSYMGESLSNILTTMFEEDEE
ncbi:MAG: heat-inducible transcriptional repressor HrcA [Clostridia bacterium]